MRFIKKERGSIIVLAALVFVIVVAGGAGAIDIMRLTYEITKQQEIVDFAALSGADKLGESRNKNEAYLYAVAVLEANEDTIKYKRKMVDVNYPFVTIEIEKPINTYFLTLFGIDTLNAKVRAKARISYITGGNILPFGLPITHSNMGDSHPNKGIINFNQDVPKGTQVNLMWDCDRDQSKKCIDRVEEFDTDINFNYGFVGIDPDRVYNNAADVRDHISDDTDSHNAIFGSARRVELGEYLYADPRNYTFDPPGNKGPIENWNQAECKADSVENCEETLQDLLENGYYSTSDSAITQTRDHGDKTSVLENGISARINDEKCINPETGLMYTANDDIPNDCPALVLVPLYTPQDFSDHSHPNTGTGVKYDSVQVVGFAHVLITGIKDGNITAVTTETLIMDGSLGSVGGSCTYDPSTCNFFGEGRAILVE